MTFAAAELSGSASYMRPKGARRLALIAGLALIGWSRGTTSRSSRSWSERSLDNDIARGAADLQQRREASLSGFIVRR